MVYPVTMYSGKCDNCGEEWYDDHNGWCAMTDESTIRESMMEDDWIEEDDKDYCPKCYSYDDDDNLILKPLPQQQIKK